MDLIDVILASEDAYSKLVEVVNVDYEVMKDRSCPSAISHSLSLCSLAEVQLPQPI